MCIRDRNKDGLIQGMKIRLDGDAARKYRWLSSRPSRMENGARSYSWIHVTGDTTHKRAYLTEGPQMCIRDRSRRCAVTLRANWNWSCPAKGNHRS